MNNEMTHREILERDVVERYVRHQLSPDERRAFQEHFFACDECFGRAQDTARFIAGVRAASSTGALAIDGRVYEPGRDSGRRGWLRPALALSFAASLMLAVALAWLWFSQIPALRQEIARERHSRAEIEQRSENETAEAREELEQQRRQLEAEKDERLRLEQRLAQSSGESESISEANVPVVTLESTRDSSAPPNRVTLSASSHRLLLWITVEPGSRFDSFRVQVLDRDNSPVEVVTGARPNQYGALTISVPAGRFQSGAYVIKLYGQRGQSSELLGDYDLRVVRR